MRSERNGLASRHKPRLAYCRDVGHLIVLGCVIMLSQMTRLFFKELSLCCHFMYCFAIECMHIMKQIHIQADNSLIKKMN